MARMVQVELVRMVGGTTEQKISSLNMTLRQMQSDDPEIKIKDIKKVSDSEFHIIYNGEVGHNPPGIEFREVTKMLEDMELNDAEDVIGDL